MQGAQWMPALGSSFGLFIGLAIGGFVVRGTQNILGAIGGIILGAIGGAIGGLVIGSVCKEITCRSNSKRMHRPGRR
jgi:hypothetical protein